MALARASKFVIDRFDDPSLAGWTLNVAGANSITQKTEQKTVGNITYTETRIDINISDASNPCEMRRIAGGLRKISLVATLLLPTTASAGAKRTVLGLETNYAGGTNGVVYVHVDENGKVLVGYTLVGGGGSTLTTTNSHAGVKARITIVVDWDAHYLKVIVSSENGVDVLEATDFGTPNTDTGTIDHIVIGTRAPEETFSFSVYALAFADALPTAKFTIEGFDTPFSHGVAYSKTLGVYAVPYVDPDGNCKIAIYGLNDALVKTIDLGETVTVGDEHEYVDAKFIKENDNVYLYAVVGRHLNVGTLVKIDPSTWTIIWKKSLPTGTYPRIAVFKDKVVVIQREGNGVSRPLYMHIYDKDGSLVESKEIVSAPSNIYIYPDNGTENSRDGRFLFIAWTWYDNVNYTRNNVYLVMYDAETDKWYAYNGKEKTLPIPYNDSDCLVSTEHSCSTLQFRSGKLYIWLCGAYKGVIAKLLEYNPETHESTTLYNGLDDNLSSIMQTYFVYDETSGLAVSTTIDYDHTYWYQRSTILFKYVTLPGYCARLLDLENRLLAFANVKTDLIEVYEISWSSTDPPNAETTFYTPSAVPTAPTPIQEVSQQIISMLISIFQIIIPLLALFLIIMLIFAFVGKLAEKEERK